MLNPALSFDSKTWGHDEATSAWFKSLRAPTGIPCCDYADGNRIEAPDYKPMPDGTYEVLVKGEWVHVEKVHVLKGSNRVGYAIYWGRKGITYCFLPGADL